MGIVNYFKKTIGMKALSTEQANQNEQAGLVGVRKDDDIFKAYIPDFLYKPPYGMPRKDNTPQFKKLAQNPYIFSVIKTLCDEVTSNPWEVRVKEEFQDEGTDYSDKIKEITKFLKNPNGNDESLQHILRQLVTDLLETDSGVLVKVFNHLGKMKQMFARDGSLFLKNTDIYGYLGNRADFVLPLPDGFSGVAIDFGGTPTVSQQQIMKQYSLLYKEQAAYFQYGWTAGSMPVPFGKREIIYMMQMPRGDSIYGTSPIGRLTEIILNLIYGADFNLDFYTNNNMPDGAIQLLGGSQDHVKQFRENMESQFKFTDSLGNKRKRFYKHPISTVPVEFTPFTISAKDMEVLAQQKWFTKVMWMCFGVNADEMGFTEDSNKSDGENQIATFKRKATKPLFDVIEYHFNTQLLTEFFDNTEPSDVPLEFVFDRYDVQEDTAKHTLLEQEIRMGVKTPMMVAKELGIDLTELEGELEKQEEKEIERFERENGEDDYDDNAIFNKKPEEKSRTKGAKDKKKRKSSGRKELTRNIRNKKKLGDCYECSGGKLLDLLSDGEASGWKLIHGTAIGQGNIMGIKHGHSWLEHGDVVFDYSNNKTIIMRKEKYYKIGQITNTKKYTAEEMNKKIIETGHWGPWDEKIYTREEIKKQSKDSVKLNRGYIDLALSKIPENKKIKLNKVWEKMLAGKDTLGLHSKDGIWNKKRVETVHKEIYVDYLKNINKAKSSNPDVIFMAGIPGSGKTFNTKKMFKYSDDGLTAIHNETGKTYMIINSDDIKTKLPEYDGGMGATIVHEESSTLSKKIMRLAIDQKANVIFDGTLSNAENSLKKVEYFKEAGYTAQAIYVDSDVESAIYNAFERFKTNGRYTHYKMIAEAEPSVRNTINKLRDKFNNIDVIKSSRENIQWDKI